MDLNLDNLGTPEFWRSLSSDDELRMTFVVPTGRAKICPNTNLALSADALGLPEATLCLDRLARQGGVELQVRSMFDIDVFESTSQDGDPLKENLIITGSSNVNVATQSLLDRTMSGDVYGVGFMPPYNQTPQVISARNNKNFNTPDTGLLALYESPWERNRVAVLCAGLLATGTIASFLLLLDYLQGRGDGNNRYRPDVPVKIMEAIPRKYRNTELKTRQECEPAMELLNIDRVDIKE
jgi:hypothetical protein